MSVENKSICRYYEHHKRRKYTYNQNTGICDGYYYENYGICLGTREKEETLCKGIDKNCSFYKEK